jgi:hypothetical protein
MEIICEDRQGSKVTFGYFPPCWISSVDGLGSDFNVYTAKSTGQDGENYNGSDAELRNIVIVLDIAKTDFLVQRNLLYSFFQPRSAGVLYYYDGDESKKIKYYTEKVTPSGTDNDAVRNLTISLICPDSVWKALEDETVSMAKVEGDITFPVEPAAEFTVSHRNADVMAAVDNASNAARGLTITFEADGEVETPTMIEVTRQEKLQIGLTLHAGDVLTVTTGVNNKRVLLTSGGVTTNVNSKWVFGSTWLQAEPGSNVFRYTADSGEDSLSAVIRSTPAYWGA